MLSEVLIGLAIAIPIVIVAVLLCMGCFWLMEMWEANK